MDITRRKGHALRNHTMTLLDTTLTFYFQHLIYHDYNTCEVLRASLVGCRRTLRDYDQQAAIYVVHVLDAMTAINNEMY